jgi:hypothetical protein
MINELKQSREHFIESVLHSSNPNFKDDSKVERSYTDYEQTKKALDQNKHVTSILENPTYLGHPKSAELSERSCTEYLFFMNLNEVYPPVYTKDGLTDFYNSLKMLCAEILNKQITVDDKIRQLNKPESPKPIARPPTIPNKILETEPSQISKGKNFGDIQYNPSRIAISPKRGVQYGDEYDHSLEEIKEVFDTQPEQKIANSNRNVRKEAPDFIQSPVNNKSNRNNQKKPQSNFVDHSPQFTEIRKYHQEPSEDEEDPEEVFAPRRPNYPEVLINSKPEIKYKNPYNQKPEVKSQKNVLNKEISQLQKERLDLTQEINDLAAKKQEYERKLTKYERNGQPSKFEPSINSTKPAMPINSETHNLVQIKRNKELEISELAKKISRLEDHMKDHGINSNGSDPRRNKFTNQSKILPAQSFINESKTFLKTSVVNQPTQNSKYFAAERSGTSFVNQMFSDIDRALNRGAPKYSTNNLSQSDYQY